MEDYEAGYNHIYAFGFPAGNYGVEYVATGRDEMDALENLAYSISDSSFVVDSDDLDEDDDFDPFNGDYTYINGGDLYIETPASIECLDGYVDRLLAVLPGRRIQVNTNALGGQPYGAVIEDVSAGVEPGMEQSVRFYARTSSRYGLNYTDGYVSLANLRRGWGPWGVNA